MSNSAYTSSVQTIQMPMAATAGSRPYSVCRVTPFELVLEPRNPVDPSAVVVISVRRVQIGYLTADRAS